MNTVIPAAPGYFALIESGEGEHRRVHRRPVIGFCVRDRIAVPIALGVTVRDDDWVVLTPDDKVLTCTGVMFERVCEWQQARHRGAR